MAKQKTAETSNLPAIITKEEEAYLKSLESNVVQERTGPNRLQINIKSKDENGVKRVIGAWHISGTDIYSDAGATFRPIRMANILVKYNVDDKGVYSVAGETIYFSNFTDELLDSMGGLALGRKFGRKYTDEDKAATKKLAETYLDIFGLVKFGDDPTEHPVLYRVRGSKIMKMSEAFRSVPKGKQFSQYEYTIETVQAEGANPYWDIEVTPNMDKILPIQPILQYDAEIREYIQAHNERIIEDHKKFRGRSVEDKLAASNNARIIEAEILPADLDDELPFN